MYKHPVSWRVFLPLAIIAIGGCDSAPKEQPVLSEQVQLMIGANAKLVAAGKPPLHYHIHDPGNISVIDQTADAMVGYAQISNSSTTLVIDPHEDNILLKDSKRSNLRQEMGTKPDPDHKYLVYFSPRR